MRSFIIFVCLLFGGFSLAFAQCSPSSACCKKGIKTSEVSTPLTCQSKEECCDKKTCCKLKTDKTKSLKQPKTLKSETMLNPVLVTSMNQVSGVSLGGNKVEKTSQGKAAPSGKSKKCCGSVCCDKK